MVKCGKCGTAWTASDLPFCPICNTQVEEPGAASKPPREDRRPDPVTMPPYASSDGSARQASNGSAILDLSPDFQAEPVRALKPEPDVEGVEPAPTATPPAASMNPRKEDPEESRILRIPQDESAILPSRSWAETLRAPLRPMNGPLILGFLAFVPALLLPLTLTFEGTRVLGILGFCVAGFSAPFAPIAWIAGLSLEKRRRDQGLRPERRVSIGRWLGQAATLLLVAELAVALVGIAALRLSGKFGPTFWSGL